MSESNMKEIELQQEIGAGERTLAEGLERARKFELNTKSKTGLVISKGSTYLMISEKSGGIHGRNG